MCVCVCVCVCVFKTNFFPFLRLYLYMPSAVSVHFDQVLVSGCLCLAVAAWMLMAEYLCLGWWYMEVGDCVLVSGCCCLDAGG